jgi:hypothetical protein
MPPVPIAPSIALGAVIASAYAAFYNLLRRGSLRDLLFSLIAAWAGFALGQAAGHLIHLNWGMIGSTYVIEGSVLAWLLVLTMSWVRMPRRQQPPRQG